MKKRVLTILIILALLSGTMPVSSSVVTDTPSRVINLVYDDSSSMFGTQNDKWCQAKYAMEVFVAMLGINDRMNIFYMSDFFRYDDASCRLSLKGSDGASANVAKVHAESVRGVSTPFTTVQGAYQSLKKESADEKWLVILTDGGFNEIDVSEPVKATEQLDNFFIAKASDINVMYMTIGGAVIKATENVSENIYCEHAATSNEILGKIIDICTRIFNLDKLKVDTNTNKFSFDVPLSQIIVFAQGKNVSVGGIKDASGKTTDADSSVSVEYSKGVDDIDTSSMVADNLSGIISTFNSSFPSGDYSVDISGADTVEIYYKPDIEIKVRLTDSEGAEITNFENMPIGEYKLEMLFVDRSNGVGLPVSELLGNIEFSASVTNNGTVHNKVYKNGDTIKFENGDFVIEAVGRYLKYNSVTTKISGSCQRGRSLKFIVTDNPVYTITKDGLKNSDKPALLKVMIEDENNEGQFNDMTDEMWSYFDDSTVAAFRNKDAKLGKLTVKKSQSTGVLEIYPSMYSNDPMENDTGIFDYTVTHFQSDDNTYTITGEITVSMKIEDDIAFLVRYAVPITVLLILLGIALIVFWWMTRKVLPRNISYVSTDTYMCKFGTSRHLTVSMMSPEYNRRKKKLTVKTPRNTGGAISMSLTAVDRRYVSSAARRIRVTDVTAPSCVSKAVVSGCEYNKNKKNKLSNNGEEANVLQEFSNGETIEIIFTHSGVRYKYCTTLQHK